MSSEATKDSDVDRNKDYLYRVLVSDPISEHEKLFAGAVGIVKQHSRHPCTRAVLEAAGKDIVVTKALFLFAMNRDSSLRQHVIDHRGTCGNTVSQYLHEILPVHVKAFLDGKTSLEYLVTTAILDYVTI